jgi:hypothetical protein
VLRFFIIIFFFLVSLEANSNNDELAYLNSIRNHAGLINLKRNEALEKAATAHAQYLIKNQHNGHYEKKDKPAFTGVTPSQRVIKAGYPTTFVMENISINTEGYTKTIDNLFSAIYHRFVFLNLDKNEIGFGSALSQRKRKINRAYVYDMGSSIISELCNETYSMVNGVYYIKNICSKNNMMVPKLLFEEKKDEVRRKNRDIILYPYEGQNNIWPAFYNESPDPLPGYKVSGFPISVQFNPAYYTNVKLKSFLLYDVNGKEIKETKVLQQNNDKNYLFTKFEFALLPLKRLEFNTKYRVLFEAIADGKKVNKDWEFRTKKLHETLYEITTNKTKLTVKAGSTAVLYMVPSSKQDIIHGYRSSGGIKVSFLDQNTLKVTFPKRSSSGRVSLDAGKKKVFFDVQ